VPVTGWRRGRDRRRARYVAAMPRAFPIIHVGDVARTAEFYAQLLGFVEDVRNPPPARARRPTSACSLTIPESALSVPIGRAHAGHPAGFRSPVRAVCVRRRRLQPGRCRGGRSAARTRDDALGERIAYVADAEGNPSRLPPQRDTGIGLDAACASAFRFELGKRPPPIPPPTAAARNSCQSQSKRRLTAGSLGMFDAVPAPSNSRRDRRSVGPVPRCGQRTVTRHSVGICWNQAHAAVGRAEAMRYSLIRRRSAGRQSGTDNSEASRKGVQYRRNNLPVCGPGTVRVSSSFSSRVSMPPNLLARSLAPCAARPTGARLRTSAQRTRRWCA